MKRWLVLLLALLLLTGCGTPGETAPTTVPTIPKETALPPETTLPAETTVPPETTLPVETTPPPETEPMLPEILQNATPYSYDERLMLLPLPEGVGNWAFRLELLGDGLLLWQEDWSDWGLETFYFWLLSLETGELLAEATVDVHGYTKPMVFHDHISIWAPGTRDLIVLDETLELKGRWDLPEEWGRAVMGGDDRVYTLMEDHILEHHMESGEERRLLEGAEYLRGYRDGKTGTFYEYRPDVLSWSRLVYLDYETGEIKQVTDTEQFGLHVFVGWNHSADKVYALNDGSLLLEYYHREGYYRPEKLCIYSPEGEFRTAFDLTIGEHGWSLVPDAIWVEQLSGYLACMVDGRAAEPALFFWPLGMGDGEDDSPVP